MLFSFTISAQEHTETIKKELRFSQTSDDNLLIINNVNGHINVEGYNGSTILVEVEKTIKGKSRRHLEQGKEEVTLGVHEEDNDILLYVKTPCSQVKSTQNKDGKWCWQTWKNNCNWGSGIHFHMDITVKVPFNTNIDISTVNDGDLEVKNVSGEVSANNINGHITLKQISGKTYVHAINGNVNIEYTKNPAKDSRYYSLNGDINAFFKRGLSAEVAFESFNGDFYTNIDDDEIKALPTKAIKEKKKGKGIKYKIGGKSKMQVRNGDVYLDFETFNGNVYLKEL